MRLTNCPSQQCGHGGRRLAPSHALSTRLRLRLRLRCGPGSSPMPLSPIGPATGIRPPPDVHVYKFTSARRADCRLHCPDSRGRCLAVPPWLFATCTVETTQGARLRQLGRAVWSSRTQVENESLVRPDLTPHDLAALVQVVGMHSTHYYSTVCRMLVAVNSDAVTTLVAGQTSK